MSIPQSRIRRILYKTHPILDCFSDWLSNRATSLHLRLTGCCQAPAQEEGHPESGKGNLKQKPTFPMLFHGAPLSLYQHTDSGQSCAMRNVLHGGELSPDRGTASLNEYVFDAVNKEDTVRETWSVSVETVRRVCLHSGTFKPGGH